MSELANALLQPMLKASDKDLGGGTIVSVVITGIVVVFIGLIILILLVSVYGSIFDSLNRKKAEKQKAELEAKARENAPTQKAAPMPAETAPPVIEDGIEEEIVAVITAAIAAMSAGSGKKLMLRSISTAKGSRNAWAAAGIAENTRPF